MQSVSIPKSSDLERGDWDRPAISSLQRETFRTEREFCRLVDPHLEKLSKGKRKCLRLRPQDMELGRKFDATVEVWNKRGGDFSGRANGEILKVELECGFKQKRWRESVPNRAAWPYGYNLLYRKDYNELDVFAKYGPEFQSSFFAISAPLLERYIATGEVKKKQIRHSLDFNTCDMVWAVPWKVIDRDYNEDLGDDRMFLCRDDLPRLANCLYRFAKVKAAAARNP